MRYLGFLWYLIIVSPPEINIEQLNFQYTVFAEKKQRMCFCNLVFFYKVYYSIYKVVMLAVKSTDRFQEAIDCGWRKK